VATGNSEKENTQSAVASDKDIQLFLKYKKKIRKIIRRKWGIGIDNQLLMF
jgi:hypothetical protein